MRLNQLSKHFYHSDWGISNTWTLNASTASSGIGKRWPLILFFMYGNKKRGIIGIAEGWLFVRLKIQSIYNENCFVSCVLKTDKTDNLFVIDKLNNFPVPVQITWSLPHVQCLFGFIKLYIEMSHMTWHVNIL